MWAFAFASHAHACRHMHACVPPPTESLRVVLVGHMGPLSTAWPTDGIEALNCARVCVCVRACVLCVGGGRGGWVAGWLWWLAGVCVPPPPPPPPPLQR